LSKSRKRRPNYHRDWRAAHPEKQKQYGRKSYLRHREKRLAAAAHWKKKNPERVKEYTSRKERRAHRTAAQRRHAAKKFGFIECTDYPPPPTGNKCAICHREMPLCLDHDHETGKFRGYICRDCNLGLGKLGDTVEAIRRVLLYMQGQ
jgi:Zn-finger protein